jgi:hypothetical protein
MSGLKNTAKRMVNASAGRGYKTDSEIRQEKKAKVQQKKDKIFSSADLPDEELIRRNERRKAAKRQGSRANTVLTNPDQLG